MFAPHGTPAPAVDVGLAQRALELLLVAVSAAGGLHPGGAQTAVGEHANIGRTTLAAGDRIRQNHHVGHVDLRDQ